MPPRGCQCDRKRDYGGDGTDKPFCSERVEALEQELQELRRYFEGRDRHPLGGSCDRAERMLESAKLKVPTREETT